MKKAPTRQRRAIIDIGSNSIRLVIFGGALRAPVTLYNEKCAAGLGRGVNANGALDKADSEIALEALARFAALVKLMDVHSLQVVATAAVRDASNGKQFVKQIKALGLPVRLLSGNKEAETSGYGVIAALPDADGIVVDFGGGSMELVRVSGGKVHDFVSLPIGIFRASELMASGKNKLRKHLQKLIADIPWLWAANDLPLYLVGGSWRALARVHIAQTNAVLPVIGNYEIPVGDAVKLPHQIAETDVEILHDIPSMPPARAPLLADSAATLAALCEIISPSKLMVCAFGLREGLLYRALGDADKSADPLIAGARHAAQLSGRFPGYGDALADWIEALFPGEKKPLLRLRHAACLLADLGWSSNPEFRALSSEELALHGNWVGVTGPDRALLATALYVCFGGKGDELDKYAPLMEPHLAERARIWGLAIRLGHRLSGGTARALQYCPIKVTDERIILKIPAKYSALDSPAVRGRLGKLADALKLEPVVKLG